MDKPVALKALADAETVNVHSKPFTTINTMDAWVVKFTTHPGWENNGDSDKLIIGIGGKLKLTLLTQTGEDIVWVSPGEVFRVPAQTWHRAEADGVVEAFALCDYATTKTQANDPRG